MLYVEFMRLWGMIGWVTSVLELSLLGFHRLKFLIHIFCWFLRKKSWQRFRFFWLLYLFNQFHLFSRMVHNSKLWLCSFTWFARRCIYLLPNLRPNPSQNRLTSFKFLVLLPYKLTYIFDQDYLMLSVPVLKELFNRQGWLVTEMQHKHLETWLHKSHVVLAVQIKPVVCDELSHLGRV